MKKKQLYEAPVFVAYDVEFESEVLQASDKGGIKDIDSNNVTDDTSNWGGTI